MPYARGAVVLWRVHGVVAAAFAAVDTISLLLRLGLPGRPRSGGSSGAIIRHCPSVNSILATAAPTQSAGLDQPRRGMATRLIAGRGATEQPEQRADPDTPEPHSP